MYTSRNLGLLASLLAAAAVSAAAQTAPAEPSPATQTPPVPVADTEAIVVTGSRIVRRDFAAPNPVVSLDAKAIQDSGFTNLTDYLTRVPALTNSLDRTQTAGSNRLNTQPFGAAGLNLLDLRGLGPQRTLVLVNGRRHVAGQVNTAAIDVNLIPTDLVERVDVLTGGTSAVYGADGVSGVVNFILKRDFSGVAVRGQSGISQEGDAPNRFVSALAGRNFGGGRGNVTAYYEYNYDGPLANDDREYLTQFRRRYLIPNDARNTDPSATALVLQGDLRYPGESLYGAIDTNGDGVPDFRGDGRPYNSGRPVSFYETGGDSTPVAGFVGDLLPELERHAVNLVGHYDFSDGAKLTLEGKFVQVTATTFDSPVGNYPGSFTLDNPFIPATIIAAAGAAGQTTITSVRDNLDFGRRGESDRRQTWRGVAALNGRVTDHLSYDVSYTYGQTDVRIRKLNVRLNDRYLAALDAVTDPATGQPTCRSNLDPAAVQTPSLTFTPGRGSGCVPVNVFGLGPADPASLAFFQIAHDSAAQVTQSVVSGAATGDFGRLFSLPGGPIQFALGGEYRRETSRFVPSDELQRGLFYQFDEFVVPSRSSGAFDVKEVFGELNAPLLKDVRFAQTLSVGAAGRFADYSTVGRADAYSFNGVWAPVRDLSFRGTYSQSVRAPNIGELFQPLTGASSFFDDPCYPTNRNSGSASRAANCTALITSLGANPATFSAANNPDAVSFIAGQQQGNPDLTAERARTWTVGAVARPRFVPGLTLSADWYDITLSGAINTPDAQTVANLCVDQPTLDNAFCRSISRRQGTAYINGFVVQPQNVAAFRTAGLDVNLAYTRRTALGRLDLRFVGGYLDRLATVATPGAQPEIQLEQPRRPRFNFVASPTLTRGALTVAYNLRFQSSTRRFPRTATDNDPNYASADLLRLSELWQHDLQAQIAIPRGAFYAGVTNLTNQRPDEDQTFLPVSPLGRFVYAGVRFNLR